MCNYVIAHREWAGPWPAGVQALTAARGPPRYPCRCQGGAVTAVGYRPNAEVRVGEEDARPSRAIPAAWLPIAGLPCGLAAGQVRGGRRG